MIRKLGILAAVVVTLAITASLAMAAITFHSGPNVSFSGSTATATFNISGLGNVPASGQLVLQGYSSYTCTNKGGNAAPGQNPAAAQSVSPIQPFSESEQNGRSTISVSGTLTAPETVNAKAAGCPNGGWSATLTSLTVTGATLYIYQPAGTVIFSQFYDNPNN
jgi:hypothetical protein